MGRNNNKNPKFHQIIFLKCNVVFYCLKALF